MRESIDVYFMRLAIVAASRSTCLRHKVGCVIVRDKHVVSTGYNGAPPNVPHCIDFRYASNGGSCIRNELKIPSGEQPQVCWASHAEMNAIAQAAKYGTSIHHSSIYVTHMPCITCLKTLITSGVEKIYYYVHYPQSEMSSMISKYNNIEFVDMSNEPNLATFNVELT